MSKLVSMKAGYNQKVFPFVVPVNTSVPRSMIHNSQRERATEVPMDG
jgi:hypothetical protein